MNARRTEPTIQNKQPMLTLSDGWRATAIRRGPTLWNAFARAPHATNIKEGNGKVDFAIGIIHPTQYLYVLSPQAVQDTGPLRADHVSVMAQHAGLQRSCAMATSARKYVAFLSNGGFRRCPFDAGRAW